MSIKLKHISRDTDRHGNARVYFRKDGKKVRLRADIGTPEFLNEYQLAMMGQHPSQVPAKVWEGARPGTLRELIEGYYQSAAFQGLGDSTRRVRRQVLDRFCLHRNAGNQPFKQLRSVHLKHWRDTLVDTPEAANAVIKGLRQVFKYAVAYELHDQNPAQMVEMLPAKGDGITAWSQEDLDNFIAVHPFGTMARMAMALALFTGQRKSDLIRLGPEMICKHDGKPGFQFIQYKNRNRSPVDLWVPISEDLATVLDATPDGTEAFLITEFGRPFSSGGFGNRFRKWCDEAGLEGRSIHGLRKTAAAVLAENGCTEQEIMSITGHRTSKEVIRYTRSAKQKVRAANAIGKIQSSQSDQGDDHAKETNQ